MHLKNGKKLYNERRITFFHETERYVNNLNIYNRSKNGTNLWDDLIIVNIREHASSTNVETLVESRWFDIYSDIDIQYWYVVHGSIPS